MPTMYFNRRWHATVYNLTADTINLATSAPPCCALQGGPSSNGSTVWAPKSYLLVNLQSWSTEMNAFDVT